LRKIKVRLRLDQGDQQVGGRLASYVMVGFELVSVARSRGIDQVGQFHFDRGF
jgi:hypothetical protein